MAEQYVVFIIEPEWNPDNYSAEEMTKAGDQHRAFAEAVAAAGGRVVDGNALQPSSAATRIVPATATAEASFTDGPFPELTDVITGYYVIEVADSATARRLAAICPTEGRIEMWPVFDTSAM